MSVKNNSRFYDGFFGKYILPGIILQSVLIGGGYATGREIVSFGAKYGAFGIVSGIGILFGFILISILTFEAARVFHAYDYKTLVSQLIFKFWFLFDIIFIMFGILGMSVMASATGEIVKQLLGLPYYCGVAALVITVCIITFFGAWLLERFGTVETALVILCYILFSILVITKHHDNIAHVFSTMDTSFVKSNATPLTALKTGFIYVGYNIIVYTSPLFALKRQTKRRETVISGLLSGLFMTIPWFLTYFSVMGFYPSEKVLGSTIPWLVMLKESAPDYIIKLFAVIIVLALVTSAAGIIFALIERIQVSLEGLKKERLSREKCLILTLFILTLSAILARFGIINLITEGYGTMAYGFIAVYIIPLFTVGVYRIIKSHS